MQVPQSIQRSPSEQFKHFSPQVIQIIVQLEHPLPQEHTISVQLLQSIHSEQKFSSPMHSLQNPQSTQISPSEHSLQWLLHSWQTSAQSEQPLPHSQTYSVQLLQSSQFSQKPPSPEHSLQIPQLEQNSPSAQFEHFSPHSGQISAQFEQPCPQAHTSPTQFIHSPHSSQ